MLTVSIPGGTAELREKHEIKVRHKRLVEIASIGAAGALAKLPADQDELESATLAELDLTSEEAERLFALQDATIIASLDSWTLPGPIPTLATIGDLDPDVFDALAEATRDTGTALAAGVNFDPPDPNSSGFETSPTEPSDDSAVVLRADEEQGSTDTQPSSTKSGDIDEPSPDSLTSSI